MSMRIATLASALAVVFASSAVNADWFVGDDYKMHYPQLPDLSPNGMDVLASLTVNPTGQVPMVKVLADDFLCKGSGPITDIHIWGSWLQDLFAPEPDHGTFVLGIYSDIPDPDGTGPAYSLPGELLWSMKFRPGEYIARVEATGPERFFDPNLNEIIGTDFTAWQYNFYIDEPLAFRQEEGRVYWLSVMNIDPDNDGAISVIDVSNVLAGYNRFGWKSSRDHWNDDAVFIDLPGVFNMPVDAIYPPHGAGTVMPWQELINPLTGESMDLAFVITPEPATLALLSLGALAVLRRR